MSKFFALSIRLPFVVIWLALVVVLRGNSTARWIFGAVAGVAACLHLGALLGGMIENWIAPPGGSLPVPFYGILLGGGIGALAGLVIGLLCARNLTAYWVLQCTMMAIVLLAPLK